MEDSIDVQQDATTGGTQQVNISDKMLHDIQLLVSCLARQKKKKEEQDWNLF